MPCHAPGCKPPPVATAAPGAVSVEASQRPRVAATLREQGRMGSVLDDAPVVDDQDPVGEPGRSAAGAR